MAADTKNRLYASVDPLKTLYAVIVALALTKGIELFLVPTESSAGFHLEDLKSREFHQWVLFLVFVGTLVRFFHGAVRHLDVRYKERAGSVRFIKLSAIFDFLLLSSEGIVFLTLAQLQRDQRNFIWVYLVLLSIDVVWAQTALWTSGGGAKSPGYLRTWRNNNAWALFALVALLLVSPETFPLFWLVSIFAAVFLVNTFVDYWRERQFYFPRTEHSEQVSGVTSTPSDPGKKPVVFVAGPYRARKDQESEVVDNIRSAEAVALEVWKKGAACICPHKNTAFFGGRAPDDVWLSGSLAMLKRCDAVLMVTGWADSAGAKAEREFAKKLNKPIFYSLDEFEVWLKKMQQDEG